MLNRMPTAHSRPTLYPMMSHWRSGEATKEVYQHSASTVDVVLALYKSFTYLRPQQHSSQTTSTCAISSSPVMTVLNSERIEQAVSDGDDL